MSEQHVQDAGWAAWAEDPSPPHLWLTLGYERSVPEPGRAAVEWQAGEEHCIQFNDGFVVHGGMVTAILDTAMAGACASTLEEGEQFLTADLRVDFLRAARPGPLRAEARVDHRSRRAAFCAADLFSSEGVLLASSRCTQIVLPASA